MHFRLSIVPYNIQHEPFHVHSVDYLRFLDPSRRNGSEMTRAVQQQCLLSKLLCSVTDLLLEEVCASGNWEVCCEEVVDVVHVDSVKGIIQINDRMW
jgi:hypothetical protein